MKNETNILKENYIFLRQNYFKEGDPPKKNFFL